MGMLIRIVVGGAGELLMLMKMMMMLLLMELILGRPVIVATARITIRTPTNTSSAVQALPRAVHTGIGTLVTGGATAAGKVARAQGTTSAAGAAIATSVVVIGPGTTT